MSVFNARETRKVCECAPAAEGLLEDTAIMRRISRRDVLKTTASAGALAIAARNATGEGTMVPLSQQKMRWLSLRPPALFSPTVHQLNESNYESLSNLGAGDHVIIMPKVPFTKWLKIDGRYRARNIVLIGGELAPEQPYDPTSMRLLNGSDYALYSEIGFSGATGGTFQIKTMSVQWYPRDGDHVIPVTAPIPYDASPDSIRDAINAACGTSDACFVVDGPNRPGGPWKVVPGNNAALGRCSIIDNFLAGTPSIIPPTYRYNVSPHCVDFKQWTGTLHVEGLLAGASSPWGGDAVNIQTRSATAIAQFANCHFVANFNQFNNDWVHPDGAQFYLGPARFYAENCDFISKGGNAFIGQPRRVNGGPAGSLEALFDWWFRNVQFTAYRRDDDPHIPKEAIRNNGSAVWQETGWPRVFDNHAGWKWIMTNCYANKLSWSNKKSQVIDARRDTYFHNLVDERHQRHEYPSGLVLNAQPPEQYFCDPAKGECGLRYVSAGYVDIPLPEVRQRLDGERLLR